MYEHEEVEENEGKSLAQQLGAIFQKTSAREATGVDELFYKIGKKFLNPKEYEEAENKPKGQKLEKMGEKTKTNNKKKCC